MTNRTTPVWPMALVAVMGGWFGFYAVLSWISYVEGYVGPLVPSWNTAIAVGVVVVVIGVVRRRAWAWQWALGIALLNGILTTLTALTADSPVLWVGAGVQAACGLALHTARDSFPTPEPSGGSRLGHLIGMLSIAGWLAVGIVSRIGAPGTAHGRTRLIEEVQQSYVDKGASGVRVSEYNHALVIEAVGDTDTQIDEAAATIQRQLQHVGPTAKAWIVGFERIVVTNGNHQRVLLPDHRP